MNSKSKLIIYYSVAFVSILIGAVGTHRLLLKADLPFSYESSGENIVSSENFKSIKENSIIKSVNGVLVTSPFQLELILDSKNIGDELDVTSVYEGARFQEKITLVHSYSNLSFIIISIIIGIAFIFSGLFVIFKKTNDPHAKLLFWILLLFGLATLTSPGKFYTGTDILSTITRISHSISYIIGIAVFLHFSFVFPERKIHSRLLLILVYSVFSVFTLIVSAALFVSIISLSAASINLYEFLWMLFYPVLTITIITGLYNFYLSFRKFKGNQDKKKVQWILWGITAGVFPYLILFVIPTRLNMPVIIPEQYSMLPMLLIPISFAIAVFKYRIFDIEIIINRSIVYSILTGFFIAVYFTVVISASSLLHEFAGDVDRLTSLIAVLIIAFSLNPARFKIQKLVNKTFYREKYSIESALSSFANIVSKSSTPGQLAENVVKEIHKLIPVDKIGIFTLNENSTRLKVLAQNNLDQAIRNLDAMRVNQIKSEFKNPFAVTDKIQPGIEVDTALANVLKRWNLCLIIPLKLQEKKTIGGIVLGNKLSGIKYSHRDIELLNVIAGETSIAMKRLQLQEDLILREIEYQKLEELNSLQTFFVSSITHDLKTPLTSIKMFTEMLKTKDVTSSEKKNEYLSIIEGESDRLAQLIDNVLTFSKIESGVLRYDFQFCQLNDILSEALEIMKYQFKLNRFKTNVSVSKDKLLISADIGAIQSVIVNLLSNSIKYSNRIREISVKTGKENNYAFLTIEDKGIGIPEKDLNRIFEPFFRSDNQGLSKINGTGLGLAIVKYTVDRHMGKIVVKSEQGCGSCFKLLFPLRIQETNKIQYEDIINN